MTDILTNKNKNSSRDIGGKGYENKPVIPHQSLLEMKPTIETQAHSDYGQYYEKGPDYGASRIV